MRHLVTFPSPAAALVLLGLPAHPALADEPAPFEVSPTMRLQTWGTVWDFDDDPQADPASYGDPEADPGFSLRRARIGLEGRKDAVSWLISMGTGAPYDALSPEEPRIQLVDAYGAMTWGDDSTVTVSMGATQIPYNREMLFSSKHLLFQERAVSTNWMSPNRDVGVAADWRHRSGIRLRGGVFNGNGDLLGDDNLGLMGVVRAEIGEGETYRSFDPSGDAAWGVAISALYDADVATNTLGLNADALVRVGPITAIVGASRDALSPVGDPNATPEVPVETIRFGGFAQVSAYLPDVGEGSLEIGARYATYDDAVALKDNGDVSIVHTGLTWRDPLPGVDLGAMYVLRLERNGRPLPNDTIRLTAQFRYPFDDR